MATTSDKFRRRIKTFLERNRSLQTQFLAELVKTHSDTPPGDCRTHAERVRRMLQALDFKVRAYPVPAETVRAAGMQSAINLVVRENFGPVRGPVIALNAHGDVVPTGLEWPAAPNAARLHQGFMVGRGVAVPQSDFATYAFALLALKAAAV